MVQENEIYKLGPGVTVSPKNRPPIARVDSDMEKLTISLELLQGPRKVQLLAR